MDALCSIINLDGINRIIRDIKQNVKKLPSIFDVEFGPNNQENFGKIESIVFLNCYLSVML